MSEVYDEKMGAGKPNPEKLRGMLAAEGRVEEEVAMRIIREGAAMLRAEPNILDVDAPITGTPLPSSVFSGGQTLMGEGEEGSPSRQK